MEPTLTSGSTQWPRTHRFVSTIGFIGYLLACVLLLYALQQVFDYVAVYLGKQPEGLSFGWLKALGLGCACYLGSHTLRAIRLCILVGDYRVHLRDLLKVYLITAAAGLVIPFKIGELFRISELGTLINSYSRSVMITWVERVFDVFVIMVLLILSSLFSLEILARVYALVTVSLLFVILSVYAFFVLPENLKALSLMCIRKYGGRKAIVLLEIIGRLSAWIGHARKLCSAMATLIFISFGIWALELAAFTSTMSHVTDHWKEALNGMLLLLSGISSGHTWIHETAVGAFGVYDIVVMVPLMILAVACAVAYARKRYRFYTRQSKGLPCV